MRVIAETISTEIVSAHEEVPRSILHAGRGRTGKTIEKSENQKIIRRTKYQCFYHLCFYAHALIMLLNIVRICEMNTEFISRDDQVVICRLQKTSFSKELDFLMNQVM